MLTSNSISAVFRLFSFGVPKVLLLGDITLDAYSSLLKTTPQPNADVLVYPHHGGQSESDDPVAFARLLCETVAPGTVVFSIGRGRFETPIDNITKTIRKLVPKVRLSCTQLSEHCANQIPAAEPLHLTTKFAAGRARRCCCAGTVTIALKNHPTELLPVVDAHDTFILSHAPTALCKSRI